MRTATYARHSTDLRHGASIADQVCLRTAGVAAEGWHAAGTYGSTNQRAESVEDQLEVGRRFIPRRRTN